MEADFDSPVSLEEARAGEVAPSSIERVMLYRVQRLMRSAHSHRVDRMINLMEADCPDDREALEAVKKDVELAKRLEASIKVEILP